MVNIVGEIRHSNLGASGAHRWMNCTGSNQLIEKLDPKLRRGAGEAAAEGSVAHEIAALCLVNKQDAWEYMGQSFKSGKWEFEVDVEMSDGIQLYLDHVYHILSQYEGAILHVEIGMASKLDKEAYGTGDVVIEVPGIKIIIIDLKYGRGVVVEPESPQLRYYGYLAIENSEYEITDDMDVEQWIVQPRIPHALGLCRSYTSTVGETSAFFKDEIIVAMQETRSPDATLHIGDWCKFCPGRDACPALKEEVSNLDTSLTPEVLTDEEVGAIMDKKKAVEKYFEAIALEAYKRVMNGSSVPGQKLVHKKSNRIFRNSIEVKLKNGKTKSLSLKDAVDKKFGDDAYSKPQMMGPAPIEKLEGGKKFIARWAYTPDNGLTIAPIADKRIAVKRPMDAYMDSVDADIS